MKKILDLLTAFMALIGVCTAVLVCFIIIYTNINGGFSPKNDNTSPENTSVAQTDSYASGSDEIDDNHTLLASAEPLYPEPSSFTENSVETFQANVLADDSSTQSASTNTNQSFSNNNQPSTSDYMNQGNNENIIYEHDIATDNAQSVEPVNRYSTADLDISVPDNNTSENLTGIKNNFNSYNNADQQNTTDTYVLNTDPKRMKIHYPNCRDVVKIAPENYSTSNLSISELEAQGYTTCGHCFR